MKKVLLFFAISLCISLTFNAQTISSVVPMSTSVELGGTLTVSVTLTGFTDDVVVNIDLDRYDSSGDIIDDTWVAGKQITVGSNTFDIDIDIPYTATPTGKLPNEENYKIKTFLYNLNDDDTRGSILDTNIHSVNIILTQTSYCPVSGKGDYNLYKI